MKPLLTTIFLTSLLLACSNGDFKITVTDSDDTYEFFARYDEKKTKRIQDFINDKMAPGSKVEGDHVDISTTLDDHTHFDLEEYPGELRIKLDKGDNSEASYRRVKAIGDGVKHILDGK